MATTSSARAATSASRMSATDAVPSDASVWTWRSARPEPSDTPVIGRLPLVSCARGRRLRVVGRHGEVRPDRVERPPPLFRAASEDRLERARDRRGVGAYTLAAGT